MIFFRCRVARLAAAALLTACCLAGHAHAQSFSLDLGNNTPGAAGGMTSRVIQLTALMTLLSVAPGILVT